VLGVFILLGLSSLGYLLGDAAIRVKEYERTVTVYSSQKKAVKNALPVSSYGNRVPGNILVVASPGKTASQL
jgi:hypothetical protein